MKARLSGLVLSATSWRVRLDGARVGKSGSHIGPRRTCVSVCGGPVASIRASVWSGGGLYPWNRSNVIVEASAASRETGAPKRRSARRRPGSARSVGCSSRHGGRARVLASDVSVGASLRTPEGALALRAPRRDMRLGEALCSEYQWEVCASSARTGTVGEQRCQ